MFMEYSPLYRPSSTSTYSKSTKKSDHESEWFTKILEDLYDKILLAVKYTCCIPVVVPKKVHRTRRSRHISKRRIFFNIPPVSSIASIEQEINSPLAFDCLEVPEAAIVDPDLGCPRVRSRKIKIKMLFKKSKSRRDCFEVSECEEVKVENKCIGGCDPVDGTVSIMDSMASTTTAGDTVNISGDGPQIVRTGRKRVSDFFNEIYSSWNGV